MATVRHLGLFPNCLPLKNPFAALNQDFKTINSIPASVMFYWRVKKWTATFTLPETTFIEDGEEVTLPEKETTTTFERNEKNEKYLVCGFENGGVGGKNWNIEDTHNSEAVELNVLFPSWLDKSDQKNPKVRWRVAIVYDELQYRAGWNLRSLESTDEDYYYEKADLTMVDETVFQFHCELYNDGITDGGLFLPSLAVTEYWEYDPKDGLGPIYDKTTGRQLRPFPDLA
jgi:hypothetical protein